jgi:hypothetical protein
MKHLQRTFEPKDYAEAIQMANASNIFAIANWLDARIDTAVEAHPADVGYAKMVHLLVQKLGDAYPQRMSDDVAKCLVWLWRKTWTEERWQIASDPAVALAVQVLGNISQLPGCRYGLAPVELYDEVTTQAKIMAGEQ